MLHNWCTHRTTVLDLMLTVQNTISSLFMQPYCAESMSNPSSFTSRIKYLAAVTKKRQCFETVMGVTQIFCMFSVYSCHMSAESRQ